MERKVKIQTQDNHIIYWTLNSTKVSSLKLIIFIHWWTGNQNEHQYFNAVPFFTKKGFDTFRFDLYSDEENARQFSECSIRIHAKDLTTIIEHFKNSYEEIFLVWHSLGAPTILYTDLSFISKIVLWDPTKGMESLEEKWCFYEEWIGKYILRRWIEVLIWQEMINDWKDVSNLDLMVEKITKPCKFIFAWNSEIIDAWQPYFQRIKVPFSSINIKWASHCFVEEWTERKLFKETLRWLESE